MTRLDLPDGEWAELASPRKVSDRRRRAFISAMNDSNAATADLPQIPNPRAAKPGQPATVPDPMHMTGEQADLQFHAMDMLVLCFVKAWSFEGEINLDTIEDLDTGSKDTLVAKCVEFIPELVPDYGSADPDPKVPEPTSGGLPLLSQKAKLTSTTLSSDGTG